LCHVEGLPDSELKSTKTICFPVFAIPVFPDFKSIFSPSLALTLLEEPERLPEVHVGCSGFLSESVS
jgi:hypothetical protein